MTLVGFRRMHLAIHDKDGTVKPANKFIIEGKQDEGATVNADITGLSAEPIKVYGSDIPYYVLQKGTGDASVNFGILDMLVKVSDKILGYKQSEDGFALIGNSTEPPYVSIILESEDLRGMKAYLGFFKGKFSQGDMNLKSKEGSNEAPNPDAYVFVPIADSRDGETKGETAVKYIEETVSDPKATKFINLVFGLPEA